MKLKKLEHSSLLDRLHNQNTPFVFLDNSTSSQGQSYFFDNFEEILTFKPTDNPLSFFKKMEEYNNKGFWLSGYFNYEFGFYLEKALGSLSQKNYTSPLAWIGVSKDAYSITETNLLPPIQLPNSSSISNKKINVSRHNYSNAIDQIKEYLKQGECYQINYTFKLLYDFYGNIPGFYLQRRKQQPTPYSALIHNGNSWILSFSPELFFKTNGRDIETKPMKGTIRKGLTIEEDKINMEWLRRDLKNRSENVMIVDLLRNDLGRICERVKVTDLFTIETYPTVYQMTSTIRAHLKEPPDFGRIFHALFPCGSVTGAPKISAIQHIHKIESTSRGIYTGAIGFIAPHASYSCFNVAIRTTEINEGKGELGIGGGIVFDSVAENEFREALLKSAFFKNKIPDFSLIETLLLNKYGKFTYLKYHLKRLQKSCAYFSIPFCETHLRKELNILKEKSIVAPQKVRILIDKKGKITTEIALLPPITQPVKIFVHSLRIDSGNLFLYHKTTQRALYQSIHTEISSNGFFDTLFLNTKNELTEGCITNVFLHIKNKLWTPPVKCGLLPGVLREHLLSEKKAFEKVLTLNDLETASAVYVGNSVRGLLKATLVKKTY